MAIKPGGLEDTKHCHRQDNQIYQTQSEQEFQIPPYLSFLPQHPLPPQLSLKAKNHPSMVIKPRRLRDTNRHNRQDNRRYQSQFEQQFQIPPLAPQPSLNGNMHQLMAIKHGGLQDTKHRNRQDNQRYLPLCEQEFQVSPPQFSLCSQHFLKGKCIN